MNGGHVVIVTGAAQGIGNGVANRLQADGYSVLGVDVQRPAGEAGFDHVRADLTAPSTADQLVHRAEGNGQLVAVVNCAAIRPLGTAGETDDTTWARVLDVNVTAAFRLIRAALPALGRSGRGTIVNFSSTSADGGEGHIAYASAKGAIVPMTKALAIDHAAEGITANVITPGFVLTGMTDYWPEHIKTGARKSSPTGHIVEPRDIAAVVAFLLSPEARIISGSELRIGMLPPVMAPAGPPPPLQETS